MNSGVAALGLGAGKPNPWEAGCRADRDRRPWCIPQGAPVEIGPARIGPYRWQGNGGTVESSPTDTGSSLARGRAPGPSPPLKDLLGLEFVGGLDQNRADAGQRV